LAKGVPDDIISGQAVFHDASGLNVYLELHRRPSLAISHRC
jgi:hypothetical protein